MENIKEKYYQTATILSWFTIIYNLLEGIVSTYWGFEDEALSLFGFGIDSFIEMISSIGILVMIKRIRKNPESHNSDFEKTALKITGYCLHGLAVLLILTSILSVYEKHQPQNTLSGVIIACLSIGFMWYLIQQKIKVGKALNSDAIISDANCARVCMYMSMVLLASSIIYYFTKIPYIDALGAIGIAYFSYSEGKESLEKAKGAYVCHCH